ncbi:hypothetical protein K466DRAFT_242982 [Polyporus arcularius HHB13444]|uniref:Uncharacterized protein n=1 Tax=Polyporus arcularius HHB13444 TaxID=1314778 RepID=A0A5C3P365_9APHY|nr:hypothetical protein K466DRAFT_242982 [Polyporus arcularius HHB13444]
MRPRVVSWHRRVQWPGLCRQPAYSLAYRSLHTGVSPALATPGTLRTDDVRTPAGTASQPKPTAKHRPATIRTLDPTRLTRSDHFTIKLVPNSTMWVYVRNPGGTTSRFQLALPSSSSVHDRSHPALGGFLYYYQPPRAPPLAGEIRFRITASDDPATFSSGTDVTTGAGGLPWCISLPALARNDSQAVLQYILTTVDRTVPQHVMDLARRNGHVLRRGDGCLYSFGQPFEMPLGYKKRHFAFAGKDRVVRTILQNVTAFNTGCKGRSAQEGGFHNWVPFTGTALCCFEPLMHPEHETARVAVIRVLRSLDSDPIRPDPEYGGPEYPPALLPREGELLMNLHYGSLRPWFGDVDGKLRKRTKNLFAPLGILFQNAVEYGSPYYP